MARKGQEQIRTSFRIVAAACLLLWLAGVGICTAHCSVGFLREKSQKQCCQHSDGKEDKGNASCLINKSALAVKTAPLHVQAELHLAYILIPINLLQENASVQTLVSPLRQG